MSLDKNTTTITVALFAVTGGLCLFNITAGLFIFTLGSSIILISLYIRLYRNREEADLFPLHSFMYLLCPIPFLIIIPGYLLRIMHKPGAGPLLVLAYVASALMAILVLVSYIIQVRNRRKPALAPYLLLFLSVIFLYIGNIARMSFSANNIKEGIVDKVLIENSFSEGMLGRQLKANEKIFSTLTQKNDSISVIHEESKNLVNYIQGIKHRLYDYTGGVQENGAPIGKFEIDPVAIYLLGPEGSRKGEAYHLEERLKKFSVFCKKPYLFHTYYNKPNVDFGAELFPIGTTLAEAVLTLTHIQLQVVQMENEYYLDKK